MSALLTPAQRLAKERRAASRESLEMAMLQQFKALGLMEGLERQAEFIPGRRYRADFCWPAARLILEVDGGTWFKGGHSSGAGIQRDYERDAWAVIFGWRVLRATSNQVFDGSAAFWVEQVLKGMPAAESSAGQQPGEPHGKTQTRADETRQDPGPRRQARLLSPKDLEISSPRPKESKPVRSEKYRRLVAALPCANCGVHGFSQAAHPNRGKAKGRKENDNECFPLCGPRTGIAGCHEDFDHYRLGDADQSAEMAKDWGRRTAETIKRAGVWPIGLPFPRFK